MHDITGHYNRFDVFDLRVNRRAQRPISLFDDISDPFSVTGDIQDWSTSEIEQ
jgi:nitrilase